jgi:MFS family permease
MSRTADAIGISAVEVTNYVHSAVRSLKHRRLRWYFAGVGVSLLGTFMQIMLMRWAAFGLSGSTLDLGLLSLCGLIPNAVLALPSGLIVSRFNKRNVLLVTQCVAAIPAAVLTLLAAADSLSIAWLLAMSLVVGCIMPFETAARFPLIAECVEGEAPFNAFSLSALVFYLSRFMGPLVGGAVLGIFSIAVGFAINFGSFILEIITLVMMGPGSAVVPKTSPRYKEVVAFCMRGSNTSILIGVLAASLLGVQLQLMPALNAGLFGGGSGTFAMLVAATELGAVLAAVWLATRVDKFDQSSTLDPAIWAMACGLIVFCLCPWLPIGMAAIFVVGFGQGLVITASQNVLQARAAPPLKAPIASVYWAGFFCCQGIGASLVAAIADACGLRLTFLAAAACLSAVPLVSRVVLEKRHLND